MSEPEDLRSTNGVLRVELRYRKIFDENGHARYCYLSADGSEAPNLRVKPGDTVILSLKNEMAEEPEQQASVDAHEDVGWNGDGEFRDAGIRCMRQRGDDAAIDQPAFSWFVCSADVPSGRCAENDDPAGRSGVRISLSGCRWINRRDFTGITRTFMDSPAHKC